MMLVYIAGPISKGDLAHNINQGTDAFLALAKAGIAAICPMWSAYSGHAHQVPTSPYSEDVNTDTGRYDLAGCVFAVASPTPNELTFEDWMRIDFELIRRCDGLLRLPGESVGADAEVEHAGKLGLPVFDSVAAVIERANMIRCSEWK